MGFVPHTARQDATPASDEGMMRGFRRERSDGKAATNSQRETSMARAKKNVAVQTVELRRPA